jgi:hypothetical protein
MPSSNENGANSISKLAILASAAATAAFVISQTRLLQRLAEPAPARPVAPPQPETAADPVVEEPVAPESSASEVPQAEDSEAAGSSRDEDPPPPQPPSGGNRMRFRASRSAREREHYGLPVRRRRRHAKTSTSTEPPAGPASIAVLEARAAEPSVFDGEDFDPDYLALVEAIANDGYVDNADEAKAPPSPRRRDTVEDMWWIPAPRIQYILALLAYVGIAAAVGSDPVTLAGDGLAALFTINSTADLVLLGWAICGVLVALPIGALAVHLVSALTRGRLHRPAFINHDTVESAGWGLRLAATAAFVAGAVLYAPHALGWALNTDYPVAAVSSSSMAPSLLEGELVIIDGVASIEDLSVGDIVAFTHDRGIAVRRIAGFEDGAILAQADAAPEENLRVPFEDVAGRVLKLGGTQVKLPLLGNIALLGERTVEPTATSLRLP